MESTGTTVLKHLSKDETDFLADDGSLDNKEKQGSVKSSDINSTHEFIDEKILERPEGVALQVNINFRELCDPFLN